MDLSYEIVETTENGRKKRVKLNCTGKEAPLRAPKYRYRDKIIGVIRKVQKNSAPVKKVIEKISRKRKKSVDDVHKMIENNDLSEEESEEINDATSDAGITGEDQEILIKSVLDMDDKEKNIFYDDLDLDEGIALAKATMEQFVSSMGLSEEERKK